MSSYEPAEFREPISDNPEHEVMCPGCGLCMTGEDLIENPVNLENADSDFMACPLCCEFFDQYEFINLVSYKPAEFSETISDNSHHEIMCPGCGSTMTGEELFEHPPNLSNPGADYMYCPHCHDFFEDSTFISL